MFITNEYRISCDILDVNIFIYRHAITPSSKQYCTYTASFTNTKHATHRFNTINGSTFIRVYSFHVTPFEITINILQNKTTKQTFIIDT